MTRCITGMKHTTTNPQSLKYTTVKPWHRWVTMVKHTTTPTVTEVYPSETWHGWVTRVKHATTNPQSLKYTTVKPWHSWVTTVRHATTNPQSLKYTTLKHDTTNPQALKYTTLKPWHRWVFRNITPQAHSHWIIPLWNHDTGESSEWNMPPQTHSHWSIYHTKTMTQVTHQSETCHHQPTVTKAYHHVTMTRWVSRSNMQPQTHGLGDRVIWPFSRSLKRLLWLLRFERDCLRAVVVTDVSFTVNCEKCSADML